MDNASNGPLRAKDVPGSLVAALPVILLALALAIELTYKFAPGFMSFDSYVQLRQTLGLQELNDAHPVIMIYLWRLLLQVYDHPGVLLAFHQTIYWLCLALFACLVTRRLSLRLALLLGIGLCPPLVILSLHVWKDVGMLCGLAVSGIALLGYLRHPSRVWLLISLIALFYAVAIRINGLIPATPLMLLTCYLWAASSRRSLWSTTTYAVSAFVCIGVIYIFALGFINSGVKKVYGLGTLMVWDMVSISLAEHQDLLPKYLDRTVKGNILPALASANSTEANYPSYSIISPYPPVDFQKQLIRDWFELVKTYPGAYLRHRVHVFGVLLGVQDGRIYYPFHPGIDQNDLKVGFSNITQEELAGYLYVFDKLANSIVYRPWIYFLLAVVIVFISSAKLLRRSEGHHAALLALTLAASGLASAASLLFIATAADYRYITWTILAALLATVILGTTIKSQSTGRLLK